MKKTTKKTAAPKTSRKTKPPLTTEQLDAKVMRFYRPWVAVESNNGEERDDEDTFSGMRADLVAKLETARRDFARNAAAVEEFLRLARDPFDAPSRRRALALYGQMIAGERPAISQEVSGDVGMVAWMLQAVEDKGVHPDREAVLAMEAERAKPRSPADVAEGVEGALWHAQRDVMRAALQEVSGVRDDRGRPPWTAEQKQLLVDTLLSALGLPCVPSGPGAVLGDVVLDERVHDIYDKARAGTDPDDSGTGAEVLLRELDVACAAAVVNLQRIRRACRAPATLAGATVLAHAKRTIRVNLYAPRLDTIVQYAKEVQSMAGRRPAFAAGADGDE